MKGLLLKDFYLSWRYCRAFLVIVAVFLAVSFTGDDNIFFLIYPIMIASVIPMTLLSYDEHDKWTAYSGTLPYTRTQLVSAKYLVGLCFGTVAFLISMAATTVRMLIGGGFILEQFAVVGTALLVLGCLGPALILPYVFKYGAEKGRIAFYVTVGVFSGVAAVLAGMGFQIQTMTRGLWPLAVVAGVAILLYALSWVLSIRFYQKREL
ncbi:ABC-2 transporter permease [Pseudoflavonifractor capillosus]|uniref:ABC-2 transporter permease n=1 Tax=Pseudoflavonifractor capillosus TaxID=106588 RepID=UPI00195B9C42|nr:ABC-2 transporter permease [Pseudoflavonifractor capillosus]MBM6897935.1 ABC-2 transporter permease [Pseudoflavonifractor capillosus]